MVYTHLPCHSSIAKTCLWHANSLPLLCKSQFSPNHNLAKKTLYENHYLNLQTHFTDQWHVTHLIKAYVYRYSLQQSHLKTIDNYGNKSLDA